MSKPTYKQGLKMAREITKHFVTNCGLEEACTPISGELPIYQYSTNGYLAYGNRWVLVYVGGVEEPYAASVDIYGNQKYLVWDC